MKLLGWHPVEQQASAFTIGDVGGGDSDSDQQAQTVHGDVPFTPLDLLSSVVTALLPSHFGRFHRLAVHDHEAGRLLAPCLNRRWFFGLTFSRRDFSRFSGALGRLNVRKRSRRHKANLSS